MANPTLSPDKILGNDTNIVFVAFGNKSINGKVDTGATNSSLHAENIQINKPNNSVSFTCPPISDSIITMDLDGAQEVVSADAGGNVRPIVKFDVEINNIPLNGVSFNLNDRKEMDSPILIGQNILKAGGFVVDINKNDEELKSDALDTENQKQVNRDKSVLEALQVLSENNISFQDMFKYLNTLAVNNIKE